MLLWVSALWAAGLAAAVWVISLYAGLAACEAAPQPWGDNREEFLWRCAEAYGRCRRAIDRASHAAAWTWILVILPIWYAACGNTLVNGEAVRAWGIPILAFLAIGLCTWAAWWISARSVDKYWYRRLGEEAKDAWEERALVAAIRAKESKRTEFRIPPGRQLDPWRHSGRVAALYRRVEGHSLVATSAAGGHRDWHRRQGAHSITPAPLTPRILHLDPLRPMRP